MEKRRWLNMLIAILLSFIDTSYAIDLTYSVEESKNPGTYIGDIANDARVFDSIPPNTLIAVAVSVPITAAMSICIIRCNGRRNASHREGLSPPCKCVSEHGNYMCPSQQPRYWPDDVAQSTDPELTRSLTRRSKRDLHQGGAGEQINGQKTIDGMYQEIGGKSSGRDNGHKQFMSPDCHNEREDESLSGGDAGHGEARPDCNSSRHFKSSMSVTDQNRRKSTQKKSTKPETPFYPGNPNHSSSLRSLCKPNIGHIPDCSQWIDLKPAVIDNGISGPYSQLCNLSGNRNIISNKEKMATAPQHLSYSDYLG